MPRKTVLIALATALLVPTSALAATLTFKVRSFHKNQVDIAFYSQKRDHSWPGGDNVWVIKNYDVHRFPLTCVKGERVCYGAWVRGSSSTYWGVGKGGKNGCQSCCFVCNGGETPMMNLNAR